MPVYLELVTVQMWTFRDQYDGDHTSFIMMKFLVTEFEGERCLEIPDPLFTTDCAHSTDDHDIFDDTVNTE